MDEVLQLSPEKSGVFDGVDFVLLMVINEIGWRWRMDMLDGEDRRFVWTKKRFIEDSVPRGRTRGSKSIGGSSNLGVYDIMPNLAMVQLLAGSVRRQIDGMEPDEVACFVVYGIPSILVIAGLHQLACSLQGSCSLLLQTCHAIDKGGGRLIRNHRVEGVAMGRVKTIVDVKRRVTCRRMHPVVVGKLSDAEPINPTVLVVVDVEAQVLLQFLVHPFCLSIDLWVVGSGGVILNTHQPVEVDGKLGLKLRSSVMDDFRGNPV